MKKSNYVTMDLPAHINYDDPGCTVNLPHCFLNHLLENGYSFDQGILCLKLTSVFASYYSCMKEFTRDRETIDIPMGINMVLNVINGSYVRVEKVIAVAPYLIKLQAHNESFGKIENIKSQLEKLFVDMKIVNAGSTLSVDGPIGPEPFNVLEILTESGEEMEFGLTIESDLNIDFEETLEGLKIKELEKLKKDTAEKRAALEAQGYKGEGHRLGGSGGGTRQAWLDRMAKNKHNL
jgi:hypothetical protein